MPGLEVPTALMYVTKPNSEHARMSSVAVKDAGWRLNVCDSDGVEYAMEDMADGIVNALIIATMTDYTEDAFPGKRLLLRATELHLPKAAVGSTVNRESAENLVGVTTSDLIVPRYTTFEKAIRLVHGWLVRVTPVSVDEHI